MKRLTTPLGAFVALLVLSTVVVASITVTEIQTADHNPGTFIDADHADGSDLADGSHQTSVSVRGTVPGPAVSGTMVADTASALDGNFVTATYGSPTSDTEWEVRVNWLLRGQVRAINYYPHPDTSYWAYVTSDIAVEDNGNTWNALTTLDCATAQIVNEFVYHKADASVSVHEFKSNLGTVSLSYELIMDAHAEIDRPEMSLDLRGEPFGTPVASERSTHNAGWVKLTNTNTGEVLIKLYPFW